MAEKLVGEIRPIRVWIVQITERVSPSIRISIAVFRGRFFIEIVEIVFSERPIPCEFLRCPGVIKDAVVIVWIAAKRESLCCGALPDDFVVKLILAENLVEHDFDVMAGVPVTVIIEAAGLLENAVQFDTTRPHVVDVGLGRFVSIFEAAFLFRLAPENFVIPVRVERRIYVNEIDALRRELAQLVEIIAAVNDPSIDYGRSFRGHPKRYALDVCAVNDRDKPDG